MIVTSAPIHIATSIVIIGNGCFAQLNCHTHIATINFLKVGHNYAIPEILQKIVRIA